MVRLAAFALVAIVSTASAADYGTAPRAKPTSHLALRIAQRPPLCGAGQAGCIETPLDSEVWPIADQDRIIVDWGRTDVGGVIARTRHLYIPLESLANETTPAPATIDIVESNGAVSLIVSQGGSRHRLPIGKTWIELPLSDRSHPLYAWLESD